ncbi:hypothetical protein, partial [Ideonella sp. B508-1]|uniref:hypothetical protein n=1 Tax=Ideonella sp. B508-1 TaxID=137716 RepID=UPI001F32DBCC
LADAGIGVRRSLAGNPDLADRLRTENSCSLASEFGITSKPGKGHAGYGLALTRQLLEKAGGRLILVSGDEAFQVNGSRTSDVPIPTAWGGTLAVLEWKTDRPMRLRDVYDSWPLPKGYEDDDFDFDH